MDKRSIIYVILLSLTFFFIHLWFSEKKVAKPSLEKPRIAKPEKVYPKPSVKAEEDFYILENEYQQLVFSSEGGALVEINLPFRSTKNDKSVINKIEFDRLLEKQSPQNDYFPASSYFDYAGQKEMGTLGGYYPLLRRSIKKETTLPPSSRALNITTNDMEESITFKVTRHEKDLIEFVATQPQRRITKTFSFPEEIEAPYIVDLVIKVEGDSKDLWLTSGLCEVELISGSFLPTLKYQTFRGSKSIVEKLSLPKTAIYVSSLYPDWMCSSNGFFGIIIDPLDEIKPGYRIKYIKGVDAPTRLTLINPELHLYPPDKYPAYEYLLPLPSVPTTTRFRIFAGPFQSNILKHIDNVYSDPTTGYNPDYQAVQSFHGWFAFISEPFAKFLFMLMQFFYKITRSWGISIILLTVILRIMLYPLNAWSIRSSMKMREVAPKIKSIQQKYKKDPKKMQLETMNTYREMGVNPFTGGCLPIIIQLPFLIGMMDLLKSTFQLRGVVFIPGWIDNLTSPDVLFSWNYSILFIGTEFHLLPILLGLVMFIQQKMTSKLPQEKSQLTEQQKQQKMIGNVVTISFTILFYHFPSGLNIYWLSSMFLGVLQQWLMSMRGIKKKG